MSINSKSPLHTGEVIGSIPIAPTIQTAANSTLLATTSLPLDTVRDGTAREHDGSSRGKSGDYVPVTFAPAKDLAGGAGEAVPLKPKENFEGRPHRCIPTNPERDGHHWVRRWRGGPPIALAWFALWHKNAGRGWGEWCQPDREHEWEYLGPCLEPEARDALIGALKDIEFIVDGKEDADDGIPNDAMNIMAVVQTALRKVGVD